MGITYASGQDMVARYDVRLLGDLVRDDGTREPADSVPVNDNLLSMLSDAYGEIVSRITVGARYTLNQIDPGNIAPSGLAYLVRLQCDLALVYLKRRRGVLGKNDESLVKSTTERLDGLKDGVSILLGITDTLAQSSTLQISSPECIPIDQRNTIRFNTRNYYPNYPYRGLPPQGSWNR